MGGTTATRRAAAITVGLVVASMVTLVAPAGAEPGDPTCPPPTATTASTWHVPKDPSFKPTGSEGYAPAYWIHDPEELNAAASLDMDGDGTPDTASQVGNDVVVQRGDGTLTLSLPFPDATTQGLYFDDLDDDGRAELIVFLWLSIPQAWPAGWIVPGTTPVGSAELAASAIRINGFFIADITGDGLDDVGHTPSVGGSEIAMSGEELLEETEVGGGPGETVQRYGLTGDVDFDGTTDRLVLGPADGSEDPRLELSTGPSLALGTTTPTWGGVVRHGTRFYVRLAVAPDPAQPDADVTAYRIRIGCAKAWLTNAVIALAAHFPGPDDLDDFPTESDPWQSSRMPVAFTHIRSAGGRLHLIRERYEQLLDRETDQPGRTYWFGAFMDRGMTEERMSAELLGSKERYRKSGSTIEGWVTTAFQKVFGRAPDPSGFGYWKRQAQALGLTRTAARMFGSLEGRRHWIRVYAADPRILDGELDGVQYTRAVDAWAKGGFDAMLAELAAGDRAYLHAQKMNRLSLS